MGSFPLTSILSLGGERKIREWGFLRGIEGDFHPSHHGWFETGHEIGIVI
jgi:hypothetical protein